LTRTALNERSIRHSTFTAWILNKADMNHKPSTLYVKTNGLPFTTSCSR
jgi:hypothetical protein